ncbi:MULTISPECIES: AraC family ligand binding domain-containing protein [Anaerococcus]|uniref:AraC family ligand binding domain-containing protein n=1 Tax=Anaerococcus TaxID=165779 RepID=UPI0024313D3F|nr:AraC family ligand binding domain-containing protein [Anaerococcus vaginalis]MBS6921415.1 AraC family ligand binding domain-containing protein [Anaerococcus vaginalis]MDU1763129.1 AraC family ligand binding domain-containing protein [Anaerococcus vaginalis]MDU6546670.1 AraC family ligand binding domain-containing protein [Anaerococcus vaginalis]MDU7650799.1 AraC family ligand binding domain-containing protein [Anaerococcus vaginalis]
MKKLSANILNGKFEHLLDEEKLQITHLQIKQGEEIPSHKSDKNVVVVIYKGKVDFVGENGNEIIVPGDIITMDPNELHALKAIDDSDLMVIKAKI